MPHAELSYSQDLEVDAAGLLQQIEDVILTHDGGAGDCKGRAYPAAINLHRHMKVTLSLLPKPHRGAAFVAALQKDVVDLVAGVLPRPCWLSVDVTFSGPGYHTELLT